MAPEQENLSKFKRQIAVEVGPYDFYTLGAYLEQQRSAKINKAETLSHFDATRERG